MAKVFISYSRLDKGFAEKLARGLRRRGHDAWFDQWRINAGKCIPSEIDKGLSDADYVVVVLSPHSVKSRWVDREWKAAYWREIEDRDVTVIPAIISKCKVPALLRSKRAVDFRARYGEGASKLWDSIESRERRRTGTKPVICYLDDSVEAREQFKGRHKDLFEIHTFDNIVELRAYLDRSTCGSPKFPDILLVDLYTPRSSIDVDRKLLARTKQKMELFFRMERQLKEYVDAAWEPYGVDIMRAVRKRHKSLQMLMYTQRGLVLLDDELILEVDALGADWLLKSRHAPETERFIMYQKMMEARTLPGKRKSRILYVDDNARFQKQFRANHAQQLDIECITDQGKVLPTLQRMRTHRRFPDLLLVDLYYPGGDGPDQRKRIGVANEKLAEFYRVEEELHKLVKRTLDPFGLRVIEAVRKKWSEEQLPIMIYTQVGLLVLDDPGFQRVAELEARWLLKNRYSIPTERCKILNEIDRSRRLAQAKTS